MKQLNSTCMLLPPKEMILQSIRQRCLVIWDVDGTLLESELVWFDSQVDFMKSVFGFHFTSRHQRRLRGAGGSAIRILAEMGGANQRQLADQGYLDHLYNLRARYFLQSLQALGDRLVIANATATIQLFQQLGIPQDISTTASREELELMFSYAQSIQLTDFRFITTRDEVSYGGDKKPINQRALEKSGERPENIVMFEDTPKAVVAAKAVKFNCIARLSSGDTGISADDFLLAGADAIIQDYAEVMTWVQ